MLYSVGRRAGATRIRISPGFGFALCWTHPQPRLCSRARLASVFKKKKKNPIARVPSRSSRGGSVRRAPDVKHTTIAVLPVPFHRSEINPKEDAMPPDAPSARRGRGRGRGRRARRRARRTRTRGPALREHPCQTRVYERREDHDSQQALAQPTHTSSERCPCCLMRLSSSRASYTEPRFLHTLGRPRRAWPHHSPPRCAASPRAPPCPARTSLPRASLHTVYKRPLSRRARRAAAAVTAM